VGATEVGFCGDNRIRKAVAAVKKGKVGTGKDNSEPVMAAAKVGN